MSEPGGTKTSLEPFTWLIGTWKGRGTGGFPTLTDFVFDDQMKFSFLEEAFAAEPLIHFEEIAYVHEGGGKLFKHWESGFIKPAGDGRIQFYVCHNTGRIEMLYGQFEKIDASKQSFEINFESEFVHNETELTHASASARKLVFDGTELSYFQSMSTVEIGNRTRHLEVTLLSV